MWMKIIALLSLLVIAMDKTSALCGGIPRNLCPCSCSCCQSGAGCPIGCACNCLGCGGSGQGCSCQCCQAGACQSNCGCQCQCCETGACCCPPPRGCCCCDPPTTTTITTTTTTTTTTTITTTTEATRQESCCCCPCCVAGIGCQLGCTCTCSCCQNAYQGCCCPCCQSGGCQPGCNCQCNCCQTCNCCCPPPPINCGCYCPCCVGGCGCGPPCSCGCSCCSESKPPPTTTTTDSTRIEPENRKIYREKREIYDNANNRKRTCKIFKQQTKNIDFQQAAAPMKMSDIDNYYYSVYRDQVYPPMQTNIPQPHMAFMNAACQENREQKLQNDVQTSKVKPIPQRDFVTELENNHNESIIPQQEISNQTINEEIHERRPSKEINFNQDQENSKQSQFLGVKTDNTFQNTNLPPIPINKFSNPIKTAIREQDQSEYPIVCNSENLKIGNQNNESPTDIEVIVVEDPNDNVRYENMNDPITLMKNRRFSLRDLKKAHMMGGEYGMLPHNQNKNSFLNRRRRRYNRRKSL